MHQLRRLPTVPTVDPRKKTDAMIDGAITRWFHLFRPWNDSMGNIAERDFGPTYGATLTLDVLRVWNSIQCLRSKPTTDSPVPS